MANEEDSSPVVVDQLFGSIDLDVDDDAPLMTGDISVIAKELVPTNEPHKPNPLNEPTRLDGTPLAELPTDCGFAGVLVGIWQSEETGVLFIHAEGIQTKLCFIKGAPVFAEQGTLGDTLGRMLVKQGKITEEQFHQAVERMTEGLINNEQLRFGEVLVELGLLTPDGVFEALRSQVKEKILTCFHWQKMRAWFDPTGDLEEEVPRFPCSVPQVVLEGIGRYFDPMRIQEKLLPIEQQFPLLSQAPEAVGDLVELRPVQQRFLSSLDGSKTLSSVLDTGCMDRIAGGQLVIAMIDLGLVQFESECSSSPPKKKKEPVEADQEPLEVLETKMVERIKKESASLQEKKPEEYFGVLSNATDSEIHQAVQGRIDPFQATKVDRFGETTQKFALKLRQDICAIRDRLIESREASRSDRRRRERIARQKRFVGVAQAKRTGIELKAENAFISGKRMLENQAMAGALQQFSLAVQLSPARTEYQLYKSYATYLSCPDVEQRKLLAEDTKRRALQATREDRRSGRAFTILGHVLVSEGDPKTAERYFKRAIEVDPNDEDAQHELQRLERRKKPK